jgi:hypothetical protein
MAIKPRGSKSGKLSSTGEPQAGALSTSHARSESTATKSVANRIPREKQPPKLSELAVPQQRAGFLIRALGSQSRVAELLEVSRSQPGKWSKGEESPSPERARELIDLDHVVARVVSWLGPDMTISWLNGSNAFLDGARPIDVLRVRGSSEVIDALDAEMSGAYA